MTSVASTRINVLSIFCSDSAHPDQFKLHSNYWWDPMKTISTYLPLVRMSVLEATIEMLCVPSIKTNLLTPVIYHCSQGRNCGRRSKWGIANISIFFTDLLNSWKYDFHGSAATNLDRLISVSYLRVFFGSERRIWWGCDEDLRWIYHNPALLH